MVSSTAKKNTDVQNHDKNLLIFLGIFIVIFSAAIIFLFLMMGAMFVDEDISTDEPEVPWVINDTISPPDINQGIALEIKRIHRRNIEQLIRKPDLSWAKKPNYFCRVLFDDATWESIEITSWDTGYIGWEATRYIADEQQNCDVTFQIVETKKGLLKNQETVVESFDVNYDFKTGRWTGDDYFNDSTGYGHFLGDHYEIWFALHQTEADGDDIPYWTEVNILRTDPEIDDSKLDPDGDGIPTSWEWKWGYDPFIWNDHASLDPDNDGLSNLEEYQLEKWTADPFYKDIFLEVDSMEKPPGLFELDHEFWEESQWMLVDTFSPNAITVHIDDGWPSASAIGGGEKLPFLDRYISPLSGVLSEYYKYHFADDRKGSFRYVVIVHSGGWNFAQTHTMYPDVLCIPCSRDFYKSVFFPPAVTPRMKRLAMAIAVTHELGHSLGLNPSYHQGIDNYSQVGRNNLPYFQKLQKKYEARQYWDTYESVMNYAKFGNYVLDYSDGTHGKRDADDWAQIDLTFFQQPIDEKYGIGES